MHISLKSIVITTLVMTAISPAWGRGPRFSSAGGIGSSTAVYAAGELTGGAYSINGTTGASQFASVRIAPATFSALPLCNTASEGTLTSVKDAVTSGGNVTGGSGTGHTLAYCDGQGDWISSSGGGSSGVTPINLTAIGRDGSNRVNAYTSSGVSYAVNYDSFGPSTIVGGGKTVTISHDGSGNVTSIVSN